MPQISQSNRFIAFETEAKVGPGQKADPDALGLISFTGQEEIGRLFQFEAELVSNNARLNFDDIIGQNAVIRLNTKQPQPRYFHGYISRFTQMASRRNYAHYHATIVPWLWLLTRRQDCRIYQGKSIPQIIEDVFKRSKVAEYESKLTGTYSPREYCVQYRETDFNFVSRLMEQEGIYYFFRHDKAKHTLVLADSPSAHSVYPGYDSIIYRPQAAQTSDSEFVLDWMASKELETGAYEHTDYDFQAPSKPLLTQSNVPRKYTHANLGVFDYPGNYSDTGEGGRHAKVRIQELQSYYEILQGEADSRGLVTGYAFALKEHPRSDQGRKYVVKSAHHSAQAGEFEAESAQTENESAYHCSFTAFDSAETFRPARTTPKPVVQGVQTAIVVGPSGEEIYTDEHARVKVHFHWDRHDQSNENSSCWVRVSQFWAGKQWGSIHIPRLGQEVIVEFLEGDPDKPIITGRVYNADQVPPYALPANKTQSGVKSRSSKGGSTPNFNEIRFEDKKGSEEVYVHAEKDQNNVVENDETTSVGHDRTETVGHDEKITIGNNRTEKVGVNEDITIGANRTEKVGANESIDVGANRTRNVGANEVVTVAISRTHTVGVNEAITVGAAQEITVGAAQTITVGAVQATTVGANQSNDVGKDRTTSIGKNDSLSVGKKLSIEAGEEITITTGKASIHMKKDGTIEIKGKDITVEGSGEINVDAKKNVTMKGQKILQN